VGALGAVEAVGAVGAADQGCNRIKSIEYRVAQAS